MSLLLYGVLKTIEALDHDIANSLYFRSGKFSTVYIYVRIFDCKGQAGWPTSGPKFRFLLKSFLTEFPAYASEQISKRRSNSYVQVFRGYYGILYGTQEMEFWIFKERLH